MYAFGSKAHADARRRQLPGPIPEGPYFFKSEWMESGDDPTLAPNIFLVEQPAHYEFPVHFHTQNQWQIFVGGHGRIGTHTITPITVHYAGAYSGYGPLISGQDGIQYFTLRPAFDAGAQLLPEKRPLLRPGPKRQASSASCTQLPESELRALEAPRADLLIARQTDEVEATLWRLPPDSAVTLPPPASGGQFLFVLTGQTSLLGQTLIPWESAYRSADEGAVDLVAGVEGAEVLILQVPAKAQEYC